MSDLQSLETAKAALDKGLISQEDFDSVKEGFVAAQKLKAGIDAGLLKVEDYEKARDAFFELMGVSGSKPQSRVVKRPSEMKSHTVTYTPPAAKTESGEPAPAKRAPPPPSPKKAPAAVKKSVPSVNASAKGSAAPKASGKPTSMSGISVSDEAVEEFNNMRGKSAYLWMTFEINDAGTEVILAETAGEGADYEDFVGVLPENACKYGVYDYHYEASEGRSFNKIVFFNWAPDTAPVKKKMMFASTKDFFKQSLSGIQVEMHCTDYDDLDPENVRGAIKATLTRQ